MKIPKNWVRIVLLIILTALIGIAVYTFLPAILRFLGFTVSLFMPFILGYLFSRLVNPLANLLQKKLKCPRGISALLVIVFTVGVLGGTVGVVIWKLFSEMRNFYEQFPQIYVQLQNVWKNISEKWSNVYYSMPMQIQTALSDIGRSFSDKAAEFINTRSEPMVGYASDFAKAIPGGFISVIIFILSVYFMVIDDEKVTGVVHKLLGEKLTARMSVVKQECKKYIGGYVKAQFTIMGIAFIVLLTEFSLADIQYSVLIAFSTAFMDALPVFGSGIVLWPLAIINFVSGSVKTAVMMVVGYFSVMITRHLIEPKLVSAKIGMNPILTLMAMYVGYRIWGIGGIILGTVLLVLIVSFYKAGIFDSLIGLLKKISAFICRQIEKLKNNIKKFIHELTEDNNE